MREMSTVRRVIMGLILAVLCAVWTIPTLGLFITSLRPREEATRSGWWTVFSSPGGLTLENYRQVLAGADYSYITRDGRKVTVRGDNMASAFFNSLAVTIPSVIIPIFLAALAAYGFAWLDFPGRKLLFTLIVSLLVVPLQVALIPILRDYQKIGLNGTFLGIWLAHTGFGLPLATYLLFNYISTIPRSIIESSLIDGADHFQIFTRLIVPLSAPALASFAIFQFLWVWNDLLVALVFLSGVGQNMEVLTQRLLNMVDTRGQNWHLLTSGAFVTMLLPVIVFLGLQKYFVRGLMEGSIKG
ncbi:ABC-type transporter, integral membrane subunit [Spirochaeta thermophila DSM 6578]|uniref:ABC-type transporter, integral membrane subunit n=1 Tax=Winmispira thermophila (strain ATCC 700085 / DSM 6578 / Z-1203) TaxID=869211 RepID=G0GAN3_WINT7|nr:carbohydrate ABC transporter permease [Spirochaeta thermophila]AEJ60998.1 ABC-type transporter, integral membrane subunit [Spirochaeta thermophila DSM 6578]